MKIQMFRSGIKTSPKAQSRRWANDSMLEIPRVYLCLNRFTRLAGSELVEGTLNLIEGFETASSSGFRD